MTAACIADVTIQTGLLRVGRLGVPSARPRAGPRTLSTPVSELLVAGFAGLAGLPELMTL
jgi:hypothetical protein